MSEYKDIDSIVYIIEANDGVNCTIYKGVIKSYNIIDDNLYAQVLISKEKNIECYDEQSANEYYSILKGWKEREDFFWDKVEYRGILVNVRPECLRANLSKAIMIANKFIKEGDE